MVARGPPWPSLADRRSFLFLTPSSVFCLLSSGLWILYSDFCPEELHVLPLLSHHRRRDPRASSCYQDDRLVVLQDINPQAPLHALVIPRKHVATLNDLSPEDDGLVGEMIRRAAAVAREHGVAERGYRTVFNCNGEAGQTVFHIHLHVLGGRPMAWPPG